MATPMQNPVAVKLHPITLAFSADPALEQSYREKMHHESFILSAGSLLVLSVAAVGQGMPAAAVAVLVVLLLRLWIQTMSNPQQAYMHNCCLTALCYMLASSMAVVCPQDRDEPAYTEMGVLLSLCSLHARQTAMPGEVRLAIEALVVGSSFMGRPWSWALVLERSSSSQPSTRLLVSAVLLVSELFGHTLEAGQRLTHAETRRRLAEAELRATTMEEEAQRLRRDLTSALDDESGASLPVRHIERLVGADALAEGLKLKDLCLLRRVGSGGFAAVYLATHRDRETVALKRPHSSCTGDQLVRFVREVTCLKQLSHPNIVRFIGVVWEPSLVLALEWMKGGSVHDVLTAKRSTLAPHSIALQVARGMAYLHSMGLCHRDLKTANVLLDDASPPTAKVADFGLSRYIAGDGPLSPRLSRVGTPLWVAPEVADRSLAGVRAFYTLSCDVYSFAILLLELEDFDLVHRSMACSQRTCQWMVSGWRPPSIELRGVSLLWLVQACWAQIAAERPSFAEVVSLLTEGREIAPPAAEGALLSPTDSSPNDSDAECSLGHSPSQRPAACHGSCCPYGNATPACSFDGGSTYGWSGSYCQSTGGTAVHAPIRSPPREGGAVGFDSDRGGAGGGGAAGQGPSASPSAAARYAVTPPRSMAEFIEWLSTVMDEAAVHEATQQLLPLLQPNTDLVPAVLEQLKRSVQGGPGAHVLSPVTVEVLRQLRAMERVWFSR